MEIKKEHDEELHKARHSMAHILAKAIMSLYPETKLTIGPAIMMASIMILTLLIQSLLTNMTRSRRR